MGRSYSPGLQTDEGLGLICGKARYLVLETVAGAGAGHIGGPMSAMDVLVALYMDVLRIDPGNPAAPDRDRFILSKGHNAIALYVVMALRGYFPLEELASFDQADSRLQGHPDMLRLPGLDASTGSLGQGLGVGAGIAEGLRRRGSEAMTYVMIGDGEHQEGMVWESVLWAGRARLDGLVAIIDRNGLQQYGWPGEESSRFDRLEPLEGLDLSEIYRGFGWDVVEINGHDMGEIRSALRAARERVGNAGRPLVVISNTVKGHGTDFTAGTYEWHNGIPTPGQLARARMDLGLGDSDNSGGGDDGFSA